MKYIVDLDALINCMDLLPKPLKRADGSILVRLDDVKELIKAFPKDELKEAKPVYRGE